MLDQEIQFFNESLSEWLRIYGSKIALVKGRTLIGVYDTPERAVDEGLRRYLDEPFLVRPILPVQPEIKIPTLQLGIPLTNADIQYVGGLPPNRRAR
jgi:hypothetical protein